MIKGYWRRSDTLLAQHTPTWRAPLRVFFLTKHKTCQIAVIGERGHWIRQCIWHARYCIIFSKKRN